MKFWSLVLVLFLINNQVNAGYLSNYLKEVCNPTRFIDGEHKEAPVHFCPQGKERDQSIIPNDRVSLVAIMYGGVLSHGLHGLLYHWYMSTFERALPLLLALLYLYLWPSPLSPEEPKDPHRNGLSQICIYEWLFCPKSLPYRVFQLIHMTAILQLTFYFCFCFTRILRSRLISLSASTKGPVPVLSRDPWARQIPTLFMLCSVAIFYDFSHTRWAYHCLLPILLVLYNLKNCFWMSLEAFLWQLKDVALYLIFAVPVYHVIKVANFSVKEFQEYYPDEI